MTDADINENKKPPVFKTYDDGYIVRGMTHEDAKVVQKWYSTMGVISSYDLDITLDAFPIGPGFYIGEYEGEVVASAVRLPWGNRTFYGSYYYVDERFRAKGFGTRLRDQVAREHVGDNILCVDAVMGNVAKKNAAKFGYVEAFVTQRLQGEAKSDYGITFNGKLKQAGEVAFQKLIDYDNKCFVSVDNPQRRKFLESWFKIPDGNTYVALDESDNVLGFGSRRPAMPTHPNNHLIGPLYADNVEIARALFQKLLQEVAGDRVTISVWTPNEGCMKAVEELGFKKVFDVLRMHVNGDPKEYKDTVFCLTNIDTCGF